jgi:hypothetical protein
MNIATSSVAKWLLGRKHITAATPVVVQIGCRKYNAVQYTHSENGVDETRLYVIGTLPPLHNKMKRLCYRTDGSGYDWHVIAWFIQRATCTEWDEVHPFGSHFLLAEWSPVENWAADQCGRTPYHRTPMTITPCVGPADADDGQQPKEEQDEHG